MLKIFTNCIPVKGHTRSAIYDLQRGNYYFIPNSLYEILRLHNGKNIDDIKKAYNNQYDEIIDDYFNYLLEKEIVFETNEPELFPDLDLSFESSCIISNAIICVREKRLDIKHISDELNNLGCKALQFRFFDQISIEYLESTLLNFVNSRIQDIELIFPFNEAIHLHELLKLYDNHQRISRVLIFNSPKDEHLPLNTSKTNYCTFSTMDFIDNSFCGSIHPNNFVQNILLFTEGQYCNTCLHQKLSIDEFGNIKNCPSMEFNFGNIKDQNISEIVKSHEFQKLWFVKKDDINVCKDCEFRYMCLDCRAYVKEKEDLFSQPSKCYYNPYIAKWLGEEDYMPVDKTN